MIRHWITNRPYIDWRIVVAMIVIAVCASSAVSARFGYRVAEIAVRIEHESTMTQMRVYERFYRLTNEQHEALLRSERNREALEEQFMQDHGAKRLAYANEKAMRDAVKGL